MRKCEHGVYWPAEQDLAESCQFCNPMLNSGDAPRTVGDTPKFNRRNAMTITATGRLPKCPNCEGNSILTVSNGGECSICHTQYDLVVPTHLRANNKQPGICPACQSGVHFEVDRKTWRCSDCDTEYKAPKRLE